MAFAKNMNKISLLQLLLCASMSTTALAAKDEIWDISDARKDAFVKVDYTKGNPPVQIGDAVRAAMKYSKSKNPNKKVFSPTFVKLCTMEVIGKTIWYYEVALVLQDDTDQPKFDMVMILMDGKPLEARSKP